MGNNRYSNRKCHPYRGANRYDLLSNVYVEKTVIIEETMINSDGSTRQRRMVNQEKYEPAQPVDTRHKLLKG